MRRPATEKQQSRPNSDEDVRCPQCGGIDTIVVNGVERQLKGDVICACGYDPDLPQQCDDDLDAAVSCANDDQLGCTATASY